MQKIIQQNFFPINMYLWIHFIGFSGGLRCKRKEVISTMVSFLFAVINEGLYLHALFSTLKSITLSSTINKTEVIMTIMLLLEICVRILFYHKRKYFNILTRRIGKIYVKVAKGDIINFKFKLSLILLISDFYLIILLTLKFIEMDPKHRAKDIGDDFYFGLLSNPHSSRIFCLTMFIMNWNSMFGIIPVYFSCYCFILTDILVKVKRNISNRMCYEFDSFTLIYNEITNLISLVNKTFHVLLTISFCELLLWIFYEFYLLIFTKIFSQVGIIYRFMFLISCMLRFAIACICASGVTKAAEELKNILYKLPQNVPLCKSFPFLLSVHDKFVGFKLLDTFTIGKSLILSSAGSLVTYGIMIATFHVNVTVEKN